MTQAQLTKWEKIKHFELDDINASLTFSERLARDNDWTLEYALRTVFEYKKFIFLITIADFPLTPSDQVDQAWHLHLLYTQSYWIDLCQNTIKRNIHHGPTKGKEQRDMFKEQYSKTLDFYESVFNQKPPSDIWLDVDTRFSDTNFTRVNRNKNWVIPKNILKYKWKYFQK